MEVSAQISKRHPRTEAYHSTTFLWWITGKDRINSLAKHHQKASSGQRDQLPLSKKKLSSQLKFRVFWEYGLPVLRLINNWRISLLTWLFMMVKCPAHPMLRLKMVLRIRQHKNNTSEITIVSLNSKFRVESHFKRRLLSLWWMEKRSLVRRPWRCRLLWWVKTLVVVLCQDLKQEKCGIPSTLTVIRVRLSSE